MTEGQPNGFRDPTVLTNWTRSFLSAFIGVAIFSAVAGTAELLGYHPESPSPLFLLVAVPWMLVMAGAGLTAMILVLVWIHRANYNARQLGATGLKMSPGWAVGWYFVPVAWFWKPYQAMKEIWQASVSPKHWWRQAGSPLLGWWWALWLLQGWGPTLAAAGGPVRIYSGRGVTTAVGIETLAGAAEVAAEVLAVPLTLVLLMIIDRIHNLQMGHFRSQTQQSVDKAP